MSSELAPAMVTRCLVTLKKLPTDAVSEGSALNTLGCGRPLFSSVART
jgi:hypothetical protein